MSKGTNCGLEALSQIVALKNVSMFSLIHLAKDNGINLYFCKVEDDELMKVSRPAIFHQENHFVYVENGNPLPAGKYDGYVLTAKPLHEPLPYSLAKKIRGQKKASEILGPILTGIGATINPLLGAAVGAGFGGYNASRAQGGMGKNWWQIPLGGAMGYVQGGGLKNFGSSWGAGGQAASITNAVLAAGGQVPQAMKTGNWMNPVTAGIGGYMGAKIVGGAQSGLNQAMARPGSNFGDAISGAFKGGIESITGGAKNLAGGGPRIGGVESMPTSYTDSMRLTGAIPGRTAAGSMMNLPGIGETQWGGGVANGASSLASGLFGASSGNQGGKLGGLSPFQLAGMGVSTLMSPPKLESNVTDNYSKAAQYLGNENYKALPTATRKQLEEYVNTPLDQLATKLTTQDDKGLRMLEEKHQQEKDALMAQYANYGQDPMTSTDAQQRLTELNRQYDQAKSEYQQQIQNEAMTKAVEFKKDILAKSMAQGQFDYNSAMELATYLGRDQEMRYALESKDYEALQSLLAEIFSIGNFNPNRKS